MIALLLTVLAFADDPSIVQGKWRQPCKDGVLREEVFSGGAVTLTEISFEDSLCSSPSYEFVNVGSFQLGDDVAQPNQAKAIDFTFSSVSVLVHSENLVTNYNQVSMCGYNNWAVEVPKDITGALCAFFGSKNKVPAAGDKRYGVYRLLGNYIFFGALSDEYNARTPDRRPRIYSPYGFIRAE